ncbi:MAG TPA: glycosyltransferase [Candidatus Dormibacteraeota bacterium]
MQQLTDGRDTVEAAPPVSDATPREVRCLHVIASMDATHGGDVRATADLCTTLTFLGAPCEIATLDGGGAAGSSTAVHPQDVPVHRFAPSFPRRLGNSMQLARWLHRHARDFDLLEVHGVFCATSLLAASAARRSHVPFIVHPHGSLDPFDLRKHRALKRLLGPFFDRMLLRPARALVFTSPVEMANANSFGAPTPRFNVPPPILNDPGTGDRDAFRARIDVGAATFVLLFMSRIDYKKGLVRTLRALARLRDDAIDAVLVIAGSGDSAYEATVEAEVERLGIDAHVHFIGFVDGQDKVDAFAGADAFVLASDNENFGVVVVEALRAGLPVVISDQVAIAADLGVTGAAVVVEPDDEATAAGIATLARDRRRAAAIADAGRHAAATLYDWRAVVGPRQRALRSSIVCPDSRHGAHAEVH